MTEHISNSTKKGAQKTAPFSLRLTVEERAQLEQAAGETPLGSFVRSHLFPAITLAPRRRRLRPIKDRQELGRLLAALGDARLANNLNQLARAANSGSLPLCPETTQQINDAHAGIVWMRETLISALALKPEDSP